MKFLTSQIQYLLSQPDARRNLKVLAMLLIVLFALMGLWTVLFHVIMLNVEGRTYSWFTGLYWTLTVMTTLGFGDITFHSDIGRLFNSVVLVSGVVFLLIVLPFAFIRFFYAPWLEAQIRGGGPVPPAPAGRAGRSRDPAGGPGHPRNPAAPADRPQHGRGLGTRAFHRGAARLRARLAQRGRAARHAGAAGGLRLELHPDRQHPPHARVLGAGKVGRAATRALQERGVRVHLIEKNEVAARRATGLPDQLFVGDAADKDVLMGAGLTEAPAVVVTTNDDATNIYLSIYCRRLNPNLRIISRITHDKNLEAIHRAGADFALSLTERWWPRPSI